ncbi:hypothetical protein, conserved [Babesia bigemina]|uniref:Uncharacterized protein n=1 Tax=Babesia bigemina TaxID=5866 RepID=A0A061BK40_BABBI|nr:hypothetical protein, conserved [Babesia bigemina]CDR71817.1 hypothetical protein, conserved [Babesia bigemina]|eukprot:XP_012770760.1 hypothetical protein, conserved [Babesia bigemina]
MRRVRASVVSRAAWVSAAWAGGIQGLRGLGAAVVVLQLIEGTGRGAGRGRWHNASVQDYVQLKKGQKRHECDTSVCDKQCKDKLDTCQCECCKKKRPGTAYASTSAQRSFSAYTSPAVLPIIIVPVALIIVVICVMIYFRIRPFHRTVMIALMANQMSSKVIIPPSPQAIAAVIVAIIVAIILLDLCIFRFPVGRNIRDFLVRKIPFCIAFYS